MTRGSGDVVRRAIDSSAVVSLARRVAEESVVCRAVSAAVGRVRPICNRVMAGLSARDASQGPAEVRRDWFEALSANSRVMGALSAVFVTPVLAAREAEVRRLLDPLLALDLAGRFRLAGCVGIVAVVVHTCLVAALNQSVGELGWGCRVGLLLAGFVVLRWPDAFATAWSDRTR